MSMHPERNLFCEYKNDVFVETGMWRGDGIQLAIDAGYKEFFSIDIDPTAIEFCKNRFDLHNNPRPELHLFSGDSAFELWPVIEDIKEKATFWLDSHWQMMEGTEPGINPFPLIEEIRQINYHPIKEHTIIIDDMLIMQPAIVGYSNYDITREILKINPAYRFQYYSNPVLKNILVAYV